MLRINKGLDCCGVHTRLGNHVPKIGVRSDVHSIQTGSDLTYTECGSHVYDCTLWSCTCHSTHRQFSSHWYQVFVNISGIILMSLFRTACKKHLITC